MDAPGVRGNQQRLGHLVGRSLHRRRDAHAYSDPQAITVANSDSDCDSDSDAHPKASAHAKPNAITIPVAEIFADAVADPDAITHSNSDTNPNADGDSDTYFDTVADPHADADGRRHDAPGWQSRRLLSRLAGAERRDAALSRLRQRGRTATRTRAQYLQRRD